MQRWLVGLLMVEEGSGWWVELVVEFEPFFWFKGGRAGECCDVSSCAP